jgi:uncharacterized membrane protein YgdD (TMEM256/DUF423 family)
MRWLLAASALSGFVAVALGAFGAHGLRSRLAALPDAPRRLEWWQTAASYQLAHALAIGLAALLAESMPDAAGVASAAGVAFLIGTVLFSGSLYLMTVTGVRALGAVTPLGGLGFLAGWGCLFWAALQR